MIFTVLNKHYLSCEGRESHLLPLFKGLPSKNMGQWGGGAVSFCLLSGGRLITFSDWWSDQTNQSRERLLCWVSRWPALSNQTSSLQPPASFKVTPSNAALLSFFSLLPSVHPRISVAVHSTGIYYRRIMEVSRHHKKGGSSPRWGSYSRVVVHDGSSTFCAGMSTTKSTV